MVREPFFIQVQKGKIFSFKRKLSNLRVGRLNPLFSFIFVFFAFFGRKNPQLSNLWSVPFYSSDYFFSPHFPFFFQFLPTLVDWSDFFKKIMF